MKAIRFLTLTGLALTLAASAFAGDAYVAGFKAGAWEGKVAESVSAELKGKKIWATTTQAGDTVTVVVKWDGATGQEREEWKVTPTQLIQTEFNKDGKAVSTYGANARTGGTAREHVYDIHCEDRAAKKCDASIDPNNNWVLTHDADKFVYIVRGLKDKANPASLGERHRFEFKFTKDAAKAATAGQVPAQN